MPVFALENRRHNPAQPLGARQIEPAEAVKDQMRHPQIAGSDRRLVFGALDRPRAETLVEPQPGDVLPAVGRVGGQLGLVRQAFEIDALGAELDRLLAQALVERAAGARACADRGRRRDHVEEGELQRRVVEHQRHAADMPAPLGDEELGDETMRERVGQPVRQLVDLGPVHARELRADDLLRLGHRLAVRHGAHVADLADAEHQAASVRATSPASTIRPIIAS